MEMPPRHPAWTIILTSVGFFMVALDALVIITALPTIQKDVGGAFSSLQWTVNAYLLTFAAGIIPAAALSDRFGRRRTYIFGLILFALASAACALAPTIGTLIAARAIQGVGAAIVTPLSLTILASSFPRERRGGIVGAWGGIAGLAVAAGPLVGGAVTEGLGWHWIFWVNVPVGFVAAALSVPILIESRGRVAKIDMTGALIVTLGAVGLQWGLVRGNEAGWASTEVVSTLVLGCTLSALFFWWEARAPSPMLPPRLLRSRPFAAAGAVAFLMFAALFSAAFLCAQYFQVALGESPLATGLRFLPWTAMPLLVAPIAGRLADRTGPRVLLVLGLALQGVGLAWLVFSSGPAQSYASIWPAFTVVGIGISMALPTLPMAALGVVPPQDFGVASGVTNTLQRFGAAFGVAVVGAVFAARGSLVSPSNFVDGFQPALAFSAVFSLAGAIVALLVASPVAPADARSASELA